MPDFTVDREHVLIVGQNQSGKSTVARAMTAGYSSQVVIDPKHEESLARSITVYSPAEFGRVYPQRSRRVIFRPDNGLERGEDVDSVMARVERYGRTAVIVHEAMFYASAGWIVPAYKRLQVAGVGRGIPVWSLSQRPMGLHNVLLSEARHVLIFDLALEGDRRKMAGIAGDGALIRPSERFGFGYYGPLTGGLVRCDPLELERRTDDPPDTGQPGDRDRHVDGRDLRAESTNPDLPSPRPVGAVRRHLGRLIG